MKTCTRMALLIAVACTTGAATAADDFPTKQIKIVVPYAPGGTTDVLARLLGQRMASDLGQPVIIDNRPGAGEAIGAGVAAKSPADGYTLLLSTMNTQAINPVLYPKLSVNASKELTAIGRVADVPEHC